MPSRLSDFPWVKVRITCVLCTRRGEYRLARLAARFGAEAELKDVLHVLAWDCPWARDPRRPPPRKYEARCGARFADLEEAVQPQEDVPPEARRAAFDVVPGGRE
jgi:hypothetical protein